MKQRMEIIVITEFDHEIGLNQVVCEGEITEAIKKACKETLNCPKKNTEIIIEYGDPV